MSEASIDVRLADSRLDAAAELAGFAAAHGDAGGIVSFLGQVRVEGEIEALELRHFAPLTLPGMQALAQQALARWPLAGLRVVHRVGVLLPGEAIVFVAAAARHRRDAFAAADFTMDHLKSESWFWKREKSVGGWRWIEPREQDHADMERWT
jgi:molybdopterin synthase catalytic subunit